MKRILTSLLLSLFFMLFINKTTYADIVKIREADILTKGKQATLSIKHTGVLVDNPKIQAVGNHLKIKIDSAEIEKPINKQKNEFKLSATMQDENTLVDLELPYKIKNLETEVTATIKEGILEIKFPNSLDKEKYNIALLKKNNRILGRSPAVVGEIEYADNDNHSIVKVESSESDEEHLRRLESENKIPNNGNREKITNTITQTVVTKLASTSNAKSIENASKIDSDVSIQRKSGEAFSVAGHVGKFLAFLSIIVAGLYAVLALFKKGMIKKGKLGFLNSTKVVEVLNTTYVAPKRSLILVRAHKQVFLISNTDAGVHLVSEITDTAGLYKKGEEELTGSNFDSNLNLAERRMSNSKKSQEIIDENIDADGVENESESNSSYTSMDSFLYDRNPVKDKVSLTSQIRSRVKNLKQI